MCCATAQIRWEMSSMKYWEIVADKLSAAGWTRGYCSAVTPDGWRWIVDAHKGGGKRYIVESDELMSAFLKDFAVIPRVALLPMFDLGWTWQLEAVNQWSTQLRERYRVGDHA